MTREDKYREQLRALGIYDEAFEPEISELAQLEREKTRIKNAWSATVPKGEKPSFLDPLYAVLCEKRREILTHREALGLTPKSLRKLRGTPEPVAQKDLITEKLDAIAARCASYEVPVLESDTRETSDA